MEQLSIKLRTQTSINQLLFTELTQEKDISDRKAVKVSIMAFPPFSEIPTTLATTATTTAVLYTAQPNQKIKMLDKRSRASTAVR